MVTLDSENTGKVLLIGEDVLNDEQKIVLDVYMKEIERKEAIRKGKSVFSNLGMEGSGFGTGHGNASHLVGIK